MHACSIQCQTLSPSHHHSATCLGSQGQHHSRSHLPPLIIPPQHCCRLWNPPDIQTRPHFQQTPPLPSTQATLVLNGSKVTSKMTTHASLAYYRPFMADYFQHKFGWDNITFSNIDWDSSKKEYYRLSPGCCLASFKLQNSLWPTNKTLHQRKQAPPPPYVPGVTCTQKPIIMCYALNKLNQ